MPEIISNTQNQSNTVSNNGRNVRPALIAASHFFLEIIQGQNYAQSAAHKFGAISAAQFRTTSKVTFSGIRKVYAVCQGQVLIQPNPDPSKINLVLRPFKQPVSGLPIRFFIYRGLQRSDFLTNDANPLVAGSETTGSEFVRLLHKQFNKFFSHQNSPAAVPFSAKYIGFPDSQSAQTPNMHIDELFFKRSETGEPGNPSNEADGFDFELPLVPRGLALGNAQNEVGFDIVLNSGDYYIPGDTNPFQFTLSYARSTDHVLDVSQGTTDYTKKLIKESATRFIDPCAFYGLHCNGQGKLFVNNSAEPLTTESTIADILSGFATKNLYYIYIRANRERSYNFYNNYANSPSASSYNFKIGTETGTLAETSFGTSGWPIHAVAATPNIIMQLITDNNKTACLYAETGNLITEHENNFVRSENLLLPPEEGSNYTKEIQFQTPSQIALAIPGILQLVYVGVLPSMPIAQQPTTPPENNVLSKLKNIDDRFGLIDATPLIKVKSPMEMASLVNNIVSIAEFDMLAPQAATAAIKTRRITDAIRTDNEGFISRITYETLLNSIQSDSKPNTSSYSSEGESVSANTLLYSHKDNNFYLPYSPYYFSTLPLAAPGESVVGVQLRHINGTVPSKLILGISLNENDVFRNLITTHQLSNTRFYLQEMATNSANTTFDSTGGFSVFKLGCIGENDEGSLNIYFPDTEIRIYTIDNAVYVSSEYSEHVPELIKINELSLNQSAGTWMRSQL